MRVYTCWKCGQVMAEDARADERHLMVECRGVCEPCQERDRQPQGSQPRLFTPAPNQMPGQLNLGGI